MNQILDQLRASSKSLRKLAEIASDTRNNDIIASDFDYSTPYSPEARAAFDAFKTAQKAHEALLDSAIALHDKELAKTILRERLSDLY